MINKYVLIKINNLINFIVVSLWTIVVAALLAVCFAAPDIATSTSSYLTESDRLKLKNVLEPGLKLTDIPSTYHAVLGYKLLGNPLTNINVSQLIIIFFVFCYLN